MEEPNQTSDNQNPNSENEMKQISDRQTNKKERPPKKQNQTVQAVSQGEQNDVGTADESPGPLWRGGGGPDHPVGRLGEVGEGFVGRLRTFTNYTRTGRRRVLRLPS